MRYALTLILMLVASPLMAATKAHNPLTSAAMARYKAHAAGALYRTLLAAPSDTHEDDPAANCTCNGTRKSGDGLGPCPCGANCKCTGSLPVEEPQRYQRDKSQAAETKPPDPPKPEPITDPNTELTRRLLFFTAEWCGPCKPIKDNVFPLLVQQKWKIGTENFNHIQIVDHNKDPDKLFRKYNINVLPAFLLIDEGKPIKKITNLDVAPKAAIDQWEIGKLWDYKGPALIKSAGPMEEAEPATGNATDTITLPRDMYAAIYGYPKGMVRGNLNRHLREEHGWSSAELSGKSPDEKRRMHGYSHNEMDSTPATLYMMNSGPGTTWTMSPGTTWTTQPGTTWTTSPNTTWTWTWPWSRRSRSR